MHDVAGAATRNHMATSTHLELLEALCNVVTAWLLLPELLEPCTSAQVKKTAYQLRFDVKHALWTHIELQCAGFL